MKEILQEQLVATRRAHILEVAATICAEKGFQATTIKDVARAAGVADGTIYNYFENKGALLIGMFDLMTKKAQGNIEPVPLAGLDLRGFLRALLAHPLQGFQGGNFELFQVILSEVLVNRELGQRFSQEILQPLLATGEQYFRQWAEENGVDSPHIQLAVRSVSSLMLGFIIQRLLGDETLESRWDEIPDTLADLLVNGLGRSLS